MEKLIIDPGFKVMIMVLVVKDPFQVDFMIIHYIRVSVQGVKSLGGHFACLCRGFEFYEVKKKKIVIIFQKENGNTFTLFIIFIVKSLQKEQNSTNLLP